MGKIMVLNPTKLGAATKELEELNGFFATEGVIDLENDFDDMYDIGPLEACRRFILANLLDEANPTGSLHSHVILEAVMDKTDGGADEGVLNRAWDGVNKDYGKR